MSPIPKPPSLTPSEAGSDAPLAEMELDEDEIEQSEVIVNTKHFSWNARLHDKRTAEVSAKKSLRLSPMPKSDPKKGPGKNTPGKKTSDQTLVKGACLKSSCRDTAPVATAVKASTSKDKTASTPKTKRVVGAIILPDEPS